MVQPTPEILSGTFIFETKIAFTLTSSLEVDNYWIFYPDLTVRRISAAQMSGDKFYRDEDFGEYRIEGNLIRAVLDGQKGKSDFDFRFIDADHLVGYKDSLGHRVPDQAAG